MIFCEKLSLTKICKCFIQAAKKLNSAWTGAVNKVKAMNAVQMKDKQFAEASELPPVNNASADIKSELKQPKTPKLFVTDLTKESPTSDIENTFQNFGEPLPDIISNGQLLGIGERQEFIENLDPALAWKTPREKSKQMS